VESFKGWRSYSVKKQDPNNQRGCAYRIASGMIFGREQVSIRFPDGVERTFISDAEIYDGKTRR